MKKTIQSTLSLNNGVEIPYLGLGTWLSTGGECEKAVTHALNHGYLMIDTAQAYDNERQVGKGWKASGKERENIFITTKIQNANQGFESTKKSFQKSLKALQTDYVDLLLVHWPYIGDFDRSIMTWRAMIEMNEAGLCRSIGVSNFSIPLIEEFVEKTGVVPAVNQVEFHIFLYQKELLDYCREKQIQIEAYSPIARAKFLNEPALTKIAQKYQKSTAQVMLSWCINHDIVVIPKSVHPERIEENAAIFFEIAEEDMKELDGLNSNTRLVRSRWDPPTW